MNLNKEVLTKIYQKLGDDLSKEIFANRVMYTITEDPKWIHEILRKNDAQKKILDLLYQYTKDGKAVIFGAGFWGKDLYKTTFMFPWKCFIDNNPKEDKIGDIKVIHAKDFFELYDGEVVFISSRIYYKEMYDQLCEVGIPKEKIVNIGEFVDRLSKVQYFDLEYMKLHEDKEIFLDAGCFDGQTSVEFAKWCKAKECFVYAFEPDSKNREKCRMNLDINGINHQIVPRGVWNCDDVLYFQEASNGTSTISDSGEVKVEVTAIDSVLKDIDVTFIKMDIEGAELKALMGAEKTIKRNKPKLAISIYHKPEDIWELPEIVLKYNEDYKLYLRHYSVTDAETVLYAL